MKKGTKFSDEHREKISTKLKGRKLSDEHKKNMSQAKKGKVSNCAKTVEIIYKNKKYNFETMTDAENYFLTTFQLKIFYWLRRSIPKRYIDDVQYIKVGNEVKYVKEELKENIG